MGKSDSAGTTTGDRLGRKIGVGSLLFERYKILSLLGEGGNGQVFRARDEKEKKEIALKTLLDLEDVQLARFKQEGEILQTLRHPNIPEIYHCQVSKNYAFIAMELVEGIPLATLHKEKYPLALQTVRTVIRQCALALDHAHQKGIFLFPVAHPAGVKNDVAVDHFAGDRVSA